MPLTVEAEDILGAARLGTLVKYIPHPITTGFTCGIAITIIAGEVRDFFGLPIPQVPAEFFAKLESFVRALPDLGWPTLAVGVAAVAIIKLWPKAWARFAPGSIVAVILGTMVVHFFKLPVATISSWFGPDAFPNGLPTFRPLVFDWHNLGNLVRPAVAITLLGAIESLLSAVVSDGMIDDQHDSNQELMAQGVANFVSPFFGGIPVTGVIARTATNVRNGALTPVAGIVHALTLLLIVLLAAPWAKFIPLTVLAAVLIVVAINMGDWGEFRILHRHTKSDAAVFLVTFVLTVVFDLSVAVEVGMVLAAGLFIKRVTDTTKVLASGEMGASGQAHEHVKDVPPGVLIYHVFGALLFGAADKLDNIIRRAGSDTQVVILHVGAGMAMDATALNALETLHAKLRRHGRHLILCNPHTQPYFMMAKAGFLEAVGEANITTDLPTAILRAKALQAGDSAEVRK